MDITLAVEVIKNTTDTVTSTAKLIASGMDTMSSSTDVTTLRAEVIALATEA